MSGTGRKQIKQLRALAGKLRRKRGVWVFSAEEPLSDAVVEKTSEAIRRKREKLLLGAKKGR